MRESQLTVSVARTVRKFAQEVVGPKVYEMDEAEQMDPAIIKGLFDQGVSRAPWQRWGIERASEQLGRVARSFIVFQN